jgi:hypothetical protein
MGFRREGGTTRRMWLLYLVDGLHEGVADGGASEPEPSRLEGLAHGF